MGRASATDTIACMRALITNDDGIDSPGLAVLARAAAGLGLDVLAAAPQREASGTGASITATEDNQRVLVEQRTLAQVPGIPAYAVAAHPAFIAHAASLDTFGTAPDLVLSGINRGANLGRAVLHSGTVGAVLAAGIRGAIGVAVSVAVDLRSTAEPHWDTAAVALSRALPRLLDAPAGSVFNLNAPDLAPEEMSELRRCRLARFGAVQGRIKHLDGALQVIPTVVADTPEPGTDSAALTAGHPTITELSGIVELFPSRLLEHVPEQPA